MNNTDRQPVVNHRYDIPHNTIIRQIKHWFRMKTAVMGNYDTGPGIRCLGTLALLHYGGRPLFYVRTWINNQYALKHKLKAVLHRPRPKKPDEA